MTDRRAYFRVDVGYLSNPKLATLVEDNPRAVLLHLQCIAYATQHATNGRVPMRLAMRQACAEQCDAALLVQYGLVEQLDNGDVLVHDYLEHQRSAEEVKNASDKGRLAAQARWGKPQDDAPSNASSMPNPMPRKKERKSSSTRKRAVTNMPDGWTPNERHFALAKELGVNMAGLAARFADHHASKGNQFVDWDRAFSTWIRNAQSFTPQRPALRAVVNDGRPEGW